MRRATTAGHAPPARYTPRTGELLGVVDLSGPALTVHPMTVALVCMAVRLAEATLWRHHDARMAKLRATAAPALAGVNGPAVVVDEHGWVAGVRDLAARERVAAPAEDRMLAVPGIGLCVPERLAGGRLLRASDTPTAVRLQLEPGPPGCSAASPTGSIRPSPSRCPPCGTASCAALRLRPAFGHCQPKGRLSELHRL